MKNQNLNFKKYGEWLFEQDGSSIIYEKRSLDENFLSDTALDITQLGLGAASAIADFSGVGAGVGVALGGVNVGISFVRGDWLGVVLGIIPILNEISPSLNILKRITDLVRAIPGGADALGAVEHTAIAALEPLLELIGRGRQEILGPLNALKTFITSNIDELMNVIRDGLGAIEASPTGINGTLRPIYDFLQSNSFRTVATRFGRGFEAEAGFANAAPGILDEVLGGIRQGFTQVENLVNQAIELVQRLMPAAEAAAAGAAPPAVGGSRAASLVTRAGEEAMGNAGRVATAKAARGASLGISARSTYNNLSRSVPAGVERAAGSKVVGENVVRRTYRNEAIYTDTRFKKLAGIK